ncbi:hypothetical protein Hrd1104_06295 [Halorhabdus sp. CBA1104]|uniref:DUF7504 family protein n=1 Tax=Halorhabdus sp. CBA1104 TaxID=1380432 RepID=UPI0012B1D00D|nr:hypothetical protein [Halorhabdus sp. CBA1104]QGN06942.1 hypothetical protein Hrd1104_06295 [Halorhabdus sp. CBA1104]
MSDDHAPKGGDGTAANVLCACPAIGNAKSDHCRDLLTRSGQPGTILGVTIASSPGERMSEWSGVIDPVQTDLSFINVSDGGRSAAMSADGFGGQHGAMVNMVEIDSVDLQQLGTQITTQLDEATTEPVVLCLDSLTDLLQFGSEQTIHRFLNVITTRVGEADAIAHYHIDSEGHPAATIETLTPLFDTTIQGNESL